MNMYQPALDAYQHGADQSLAAMFKLASQPTPAATFMDSLQAREQTDFNRGQSERQAYLQQVEVQRKQAHEDYLYNKLKTDDQNKDEDRAFKEKDWTTRSTLMKDRIDNVKNVSEAALVLRGLELEEKRNRDYADTMMALGKREDAQKYRDRQYEMEQKRYELDAKWKSGAMAPGGGRLVPGYEPDPTSPGAIRPIPGGPAALRAGAVNAQTDAKMASIDQSADSLIQIAEELKNHPGIESVTGIRGAIPDIPGSNAADARALLETIKAKAGFGYLQSMREASKTGGAIGQVSDFEQKLLQNAITALSTSQNTKSFKRNLDRLIEYTQNSRTKMRSAFESLSPGGAARPQIGQGGDERQKAEAALARVRGNPTAESQIRARYKERTGEDL